MNTDFRAQLQRQTGLGRPGGNASKASLSAVGQTQGGQFAAMESALLKMKKPNPTKLAKGGAGRQFQKKSGENYGQGTAASGKTIKGPDFTPMAGTKMSQLKAKQY